MLQLTPRQIVAELDRFTVGQHQAKRQLALAARRFMNMHRIPEGKLRPSLINRNILLYGPTGSGKTTIPKHLANVLGLTFHHVPVTQLVSEGYRGMNISDVLENVNQTMLQPYGPLTLEIEQRYGLRPSQQSATPDQRPDQSVRPPWMCVPPTINATASNQFARYHLVMLDEVDKLSGNCQKDPNRRDVQQELLALLENPTYLGGSRGCSNSDLTRCLFICAGAFANIHEVRLLLPEFLGRLPNQVKLQPLEQKDMIDLLMYSEDSPVTHMCNMLSLDGVKVEVTYAALSRIADTAFRLNRNTIDIGARRLHEITQKLFEDISFRAPELEGEHILIDENYFKLSELEVEK